MNGILRKFILALVATSLAACSGGKDEAGIGAGNDSFKVVQASGAVVTTEEAEGWSVPSARRFHVKACLTSDLRDAAIGGENFSISSARGSFDLTADREGCLNWHEDWTLDLAAKPAALLEIRTITAKNGLVKGSVDLRLAFNPWSGIVGAGKAVYSPDLEPVEGTRLLAPAAHAAEKSRAELLVKNLDVSLGQLGQRAGASGEITVSFPLTLVSATIAGQRAEIPLRRGEVNVEFTLVHRASGAKAFDTIVTPKLTFTNERVVLERLPVKLKRALKLGEAYDIVLKVKPTNGKLGLGGFAGRFSLGNSENLANGSAVLIEQLSSERAKALETAPIDESPAEKIPSLRLVSVDGGYFGVAKEGQGRRTIRLALRAVFTEPTLNRGGADLARDLLVRNFATGEWEQQSISALTGKLEWVAEYEHAVPAAKTPVRLKLEIRDPETGDEWERELEVNPWAAYAVTVKDTKAIANLGKNALAKSAPLPAYRLDELCLGKPANPQMKVEQNLDLSFRIQLSLALTARTHHFYDQVRGAHDEPLRAGDYRLNLLFLRTSPGPNSAVQIVSSVSRKVVADGGTSLNAQIELPIRMMGDLVANSHVIAQLTSEEEGKVESEPQLFLLETMGGGCAKSLDPKSDGRLRETLAKLPAGMDLESLHVAFQKAEAERVRLSGQFANSRAYAKKIGAKLFELETSRPHYLREVRELGKVKEALECLAQTSWDYETRKAACQFDDSVKTALQHLCHSIVRPEKIPSVPDQRALNAKERAAAMRSQRLAVMDADALFHACANNPLEYFFVEKKTIVTQVGETKPEHSLGAFQYHVSASASGRLTSWDWNSFTYEVEELAYRFLRFRGQLNGGKELGGKLGKVYEEAQKFRIKTVPMNAPLSQDTLAALQKAAEGGNGSLQARGGIINDNFRYYYDLDYVFSRFSYGDETSLDVSTFDMAIPAARSQECYRLEARVPADHARLVQRHPEFADFFPNELLCMPETNKPRTLKEKYYFVLNSPASGVTLDSNDAKNRVAFVFRGERDFNVWLRSIRESARPYTQNGLPLEMTQILRGGSEIFEKRSIGADGVYADGPSAEPGAFVRENPNPDVQEWILRQLAKVVLNPFDKQNTKVNRNTNSRDLNPEWEKKRPGSDRLK